MKNAFCLSANLSAMLSINIGSSPSGIEDRLCPKTISTSAKAIGKKTSAQTTRNVSKHKMRHFLHRPQCHPQRAHR